MPNLENMLSTDVSALRRSVLDALVHHVGKDPADAAACDWYVALAFAVRNHVAERWIKTGRRIDEQGKKRVYYLSMEFLIGRMLQDAIINLGLTEAFREALAEHGQNLDQLLAAEPDAALGNGGLGRLAACFLDSMSTLGIAGMGYGIRYRHGLFCQSFEDGVQREQAEDWLEGGHPWAFPRTETVYDIPFGGEVEMFADGRATWRNRTSVRAVAYDVPIVGWQKGDEAGHVNTLRLWDARPAALFDLDSFNAGDFAIAAADEVEAATIARVLYPNDETPEGLELRLKQEFFFTSASLQDLLHRYLEDHDDLQDLPQHAAIQLNDTHPAIAVPELMRLLIDDHGLDRDTAFRITQGCIAYTNHTLLPEALERWPLDLFERLLPRHLQLISWLNEKVLAEAANGTAAIAADAVRILDENAVRMGHLAFIGSHKVNGVSALHTDLMKQTVFKDLHALHPDRILNQTNGITPRRWLLACNPDLADLVTLTVGEGWVTDLTKLNGLAEHAQAPLFQDRFAAIKRANKERLAALIWSETGVRVDPAALFDVQIKRIHEYKRQLLNILETIAHYQAILAEPDKDWVPRVRIFAGKAAPSYVRAKLIIKLINDVAAVVNADPTVGDRLKVVFLPNYNVSLAEKIIPAADLSEQISTAGFEASGTGNMKFALNGALTIGTLDGANVEIKEEVGEDNIVIFGLMIDEVRNLRQQGYDPAAVIEATPALKAVVEAIETGHFSKDDPARFRPITDDLKAKDYFLVATDFSAYADAQRRVDAIFRDPGRWWRHAILNTAKIGWFSSDRTIAGYAKEVWGA